LYFFPCSYGFTGLATVFLTVADKKIRRFKAGKCLSVSTEGIDYHAHVPPLHATWWRLCVVAASTELPAG